jgi:hypothetical protein
MHAEVKSKGKAASVSITNDMKVNGRNEGKDPHMLDPGTRKHSVSHFRHIKACYTHS